MDTLETGINGAAAVLATERAVEEMRRGRAVVISDGEHASLVVAVETLEAPLFDRLRNRYGDALELIVTPQRARAAELTRDADVPSAIAVTAAMDLDTVRSIAGLGSHPQKHTTTDIPSTAAVRTRVDAALCLTKVGRLLPALLVADVGTDTDPSAFEFCVDDLTDTARREWTRVEIVSRAKIPLADALECEVVMFRQRGDVGEHLAIVLGRPDVGRDVPVRLHSACLTGDVLGSLRCDCGDQLKRAIQRIVALGGGVLLYLDQEGRGIGLANKLRAYALQDAGLDTVDADEHLGFLPDERDYAVAAAALRELGIHSVRLLTNNPAKITALEQYGIAVAGRLPLVASVNAYNQRYLKAKLDRAGHLAE